jgi:chemotaxis protein CheX
MKNQAALSRQTAQEKFSARLRLPAVLDIRAATPLVAALLEAKGKDLVIDASAVTQIGAQCLQALHSAQRTWARDGVPLTIADPSAAFTETLDLAGIPIEKISE